MTEAEIKRKLTEEKSDQVVEALGELAKAAKSGEKLNPDVRKLVVSLLRYRAKNQGDPDQAGVDEMIRSDAASLLGIFYRDRSAFPELLRIFQERSDSNLVLTAVVTSIGALSLAHEDLRTEAMKFLAKTALDTTCSVEIRNSAYVHALGLTKKHPDTEWLSVLTGAKPVPPYDIPWLKSLLKT